MQLHKKFELAGPLSCQAVGQPCFTQSYVGRRASGDRQLLETMVAVSKDNPCYAYRRVFALLRREGWVVNKGRVYWLWRELDLNDSEKERKRRHYTHRVLLTMKVYS